MITLPALRVFVSVVEAGGIRGACERLFRTASTVSMTLKQLEDELGSPLFEGDRKNRLTNLGRFVYDEARELLEHYDRAAAAMRAFAGNDLGRTDVACVPSVALTFLPAAIRRARARPPGLEIHVRDMDSRLVAETVAAGHVDVGIASPARGPTALTFTPLFSDPLDLVCRRDDPLNDRPVPVPWSDVAGREFLSHGSYGAIEAPAFLQIVGSARVHVRNVTSLLALVREGAGITLLPRLCRSESDERVAFVPVADPQARRVVGLVTRPNRTPSAATALFLSVLQEIIAERAEELHLTLLPPEPHRGG
jgi:LysR family transcriptional regulator, carnitine catabolism transcriptional activator